MCKLSSTFLRISYSQHASEEPGPRLGAVENEFIPLLWTHERRFARCNQHGSESTANSCRERLHPRTPSRTRCAGSRTAPPAPPRPARAAGPGLPGPRRAGGWGVGAEGRARGERGPAGRRNFPGPQRGAAAAAAAAAAGGCPLSPAPAPQPPPRPGTEGGERHHPPYGPPSPPSRPRGPRSHRCTTGTGAFGSGSAGPGRLRRARHGAMAGSGAGPGWAGRPGAALPANPAPAAPAPLGAAPRSRPRPGGRSAEHPGREPLPPAGPEPGQGERWGAPARLPQAVGDETPRAWAAPFPALTLSRSSFCPAHPRGAGAHRAPSWRARSRGARTGKGLCSTTAPSPSRKAPHMTRVWVMDLAWCLAAAQPLPGDAPAFRGDRPEAPGSCGPRVCAGDGSGHDQHLQPNCGPCR